MLKTYQINRVDIGQLRQQLLASNSLLGIGLQEQFSLGKEIPKPLISSKALSRSYQALVSLLHVPKHHLPSPKKLGNSRKTTIDTKLTLHFQLYLGIIGVFWLRQVSITTKQTQKPCHSLHVPPSICFLLFQTCHCQLSLWISINWSRDVVTEVLG